MSCTRYFTNPERAPNVHGTAFQPNRWPVYNDPFSPTALAHADSRARRRFVKALIFGFLVWLALGLILGLSIFEDWNPEPGWKRGRFHPRPGWSGNRPDPPPGDGKVTSCGAFTSAPDVILGTEDWNDDDELEKRAAIFHLSVPEAGGFFLNARGALSTGSVKFEVSEPLHRNSSLNNGDGEDSIEVQVEARYDDDDLVELANVCVLERKTSTGSPAVGVGIYTPPSDAIYSSAISHLTFRITVRIPPSLTSLNSFDVHGPMLDISGSLPSPHIRLLNLKTLDSQINLDQLFVTSAKLSTSNGNIQGFFNVSNSLDASSQNGKISLQVALHPFDAEDSEDFASNATSVQATTTNGAIEIEYLDVPFDHTLHSSLRSTNGRAQANLPETFEGKVEIETTWGTAKLRGPNLDARDPTGKNRQRKSILAKKEQILGHSHIFGTVW